MLDPAIAIEAAANFRRLRGIGITVRKTMDLIIGTYCLMHGYALLHDDRVQVRAIEHGGRAVGALICAEDEGGAELSFWTAREVWGQGLTTAALQEFLGSYPTRPVRAHVPEDNAGTMKVLSRLGFQEVGREQVFSNARAAVITELVMELREG